MKTRPTIALLAGLILPAGAIAHTLTVNPATTPPAIVLAHDGSLDPVPIARVTRVAAIDRQGSSLAASAVAAGHGSAIATTAAGTVSPAAWWVAYDGQPSGRGPNGERRSGPRGTHADATDIGRSQVFAVAVADARAPLSALPVGRLSLLPAIAQTRYRPGSTVRLKVLYNGAPLANATIRLEALRLEQGGASITTDANGEATARIGAAGRHLYAVSFLEIPSSDPSVDVLRLQASFGFEAR